MYNPSRFQVIDQKIISDLIKRYNFATILVAGSDDISVSHLPLVFEENTGDKGLLIGHMARVNPQWKLFDSNRKVKAIFHGPHSYVSPRWYEPSPDNVPTWNYAVVHLDGVASVIKDPAKAYQKMRDLVAQHDPEWPLDLPESVKKELMAEIVVFEIQVEKIDAKFKLSQNQVESNRGNVVKMLSESTQQIDHETAALMNIAKTIFSKSNGL